MNLAEALVSAGMLTISVLSATQVFVKTTITQKKTITRDTIAAVINTDMADVANKVTGYQCNYVTCFQGLTTQEIKQLCGTDTENPGLAQSIIDDYGLTNLNSITNKLPFNIGRTIRAERDLVHVSYKVNHPDFTRMQRTKAIYPMAAGFCPLEQIPDSYPPSS